jgi:imidazolonepropionase-like amidohydrolase
MKQNLLRNIFLCYCLFISISISKAQPIIIKAGKILNPSTGEILTNQIILIEGDKIKEVGSNLQIPAQARVIELVNSTVMPGLVDAHTHLCARFKPVYDKARIGFLGIPIKDPPGYRGIYGAVHAKEMLMAGFTTVREAGNSGNYIDVDLQRAIREGLVMGPNIIAAGRIICPYGGQYFWSFDPKYIEGPEYFFADTRDELKKAIRQNIYFGANVIKILADGQKSNYSLEDIKFIVDEAGKAGLKVMVHCLTRQGARNAALAGVASIEHGWVLSGEILQIMKKNNVFLVSTDFTVKVFLANGAPESAARRFHKKLVERLREAFNSGVKIAFGTDVMVEYQGEARGTLSIEYIDSFVEAGIPSAEILKIITTNAYQLLDMEKRRGLIQKGMIADLIATDVNPLEDINALKKVHFVMKNGVIYKN